MSEHKQFNSTEFHVRNREACKSRGISEQSWGLRIFYISNNIKATSVASPYQMAGQTPRNWQIDLPWAPIQAVASRASAMSIILEKNAWIREIAVPGSLYFSSGSIAIGTRDRRRLIVIRKSPRRTASAVGSGSTSNAASVASCLQSKSVIPPPLGTY